MKKLMTVLASAATALFAIGVAKGDDFTTQGVDFEHYSVGAVFDAQKDDAGGSTGDKFWYSTAAAGEIGDISNSTATVGTALVPDFFNTSAAIGNYLQIDASAPLFRTAVANDQSGSFESVDIGDGIYLDTLVQFTAADDEFQTDLDSGDKIAISYVEHDAVLGNDDEVVEPGYTNFVIRAGAIVDEEFDQANYFAEVPANFDKSAWHRLTVRTIKNVGDGQVGFVIYLDGDMSKTLNFTNQVNTGFTVENLSPLAKSFYDENALYPSAVNSGGDKSTISAASFSGTGALDDVVFTATKPGFITEQASVTIAWTEGVATVKIGDAEAIACTGAGSTVVDLPTNGTVLVTATFSAGYEAGTYTVAPPGAQGSWNSTVGGFVNLADGNVCTIVAIQPKFDVNGVRYDNIDDAMAAAEAGTVAEPATFKLLADYDDVLSFGEGVIILDLAGCDIQAGETADYSIVNAGATLTITNSGTEASVKLPVRDPENTEAIPPAGVLYSAPFTTIQAGTFEGYIITPATMDDQLDVRDYLSITGGKFLDEAYDPTDSESDFYLAACVAQGLSYTQVGNYVQIGEGGEQPPAALTLTITDNANAESTVKINGEPAETGAEIKADDVIVITATAKSGYEYASAPDGWTLSEGVITKSITVVDESVAVTIPAPTAVVIGTYTVTVTPTANATYAVTGAASNDGDVYTVATEHTITITATPAEGYEYAEAPTGWTLSEGVITIEVSEAGTVAIPEPTAQQQGGYPTYIEEIEDATVKAAYEAKYDTWKDTYGADAESAFGTAFLLNIAPNAADQTLEPASITIADGKVVITANKDLGAVNGKVYVKTAATLAGLAEAQWAEATLNETTKAINVTQGSTDTAGFYQIKVDF